MTEIKYQLAEFRRALDEGALFVNPKASIPVLQNVALEGGRLRATDLNATYTCALDYQGEGAYLAPVVALKRFAAGAEIEEITVSRDGARTVVQSGKLRARFDVMDAVEFPVCPKVSEDPKAARIAASALRARFERGRKIASTDKTRPHLNAVQIYSESIKRDGKEYRFCATDGHRLVLLPDAFAVAPARDCLVPLSVVERYAKIARKENGTPLRVDRGEKAASPDFAIRWGDREIISREVDAAFPPVEQVVPRHKDRTIEVEVDAVELAKTLTRIVKVMGKPGKAGPGVKLHVGVEALEAGTLKVESHDAETEVSDEVAVGSVVTNGEVEKTHRIKLTGEVVDCTVVGCNPGYLLDAIDGAEGAVQITFYAIGEQAPFTVKRSDGELHVVMPMRI